MKQLAIACLLTALCLTGCTYYSVPQASSDVNLNLTVSDVQITADASGEDWAFGIFPISIISPASARATVYASGVAIKNAYERGGADFVLQPRSKITYVNLLLFDYAKAEVIGKAVKLK